MVALKERSGELVGIHPTVSPVNFMEFWPGFLSYFLLPNAMEEMPVFVQSRAEKFSQLVIRQRIN